MLRPSRSLKKSPPIAAMRSRVFRLPGDFLVQLVNCVCAVREVSFTEAMPSFSTNAASAASLRATSPPAMKEIWLRRSANWLLTGVAERSRTLVFTPADIISLLMG